MRRGSELWCVLLGALCGGACVFDTTGIVFSEDGGDGLDARTDASDGNAAFDGRPVDSGPVPTTMEIGDVRLVYGEALPDYLSSLRWSGLDGAWTTELPTPALSGDTRWTINKVSPDGRGEELIAAMLDTPTTTVLRALSWTGSAWEEDWAFTAGSLRSATRWFDVEYEASGDALIVYGDGSHTPAFRVRVDGQWSQPRWLPLNDGPGPDPDTNQGRVLWVEMERKPSSDEIALAFADDNQDLVAVVWNGSQWDTDSARTVETSLKANPSSGFVHNRAFDLAYETLTGALMIAWGRGGAGNFYYSQRLPVTGQWYPENEYVSGIVSGDVHFVDLASDPNTDRIAGGFYDLGDGTERLGLSTWDGDSWQDRGEYDSQTLDVNDQALGDAPGAVGWIGASGIAVAIYADNEEGTLDWARWVEDGGWAVQVDESFSTKGYTESVWLEPTPDGEALLMVLSDHEMRLFASVYNGNVWQPSSSGAALSTGLATSDSAPFSIDARDE